MIDYTPTPDYYNDYIAHYGVKGMKWGRRKSRISSITNKLKRAKKYYKVRDNINNQLVNARTNEERLALYTAAQNAHAKAQGYKKFKATNKGGKYSSTEPIDTDQKRIQRYIDDEKRIKQKKKK